MQLFQKLRVHHAARLIHFYVTNGFVGQKVFSPLLPDCPAFECWMEEDNWLHHNNMHLHSLCVACMEATPPNQCSWFVPYQVVKFMKRHSMEEQLQILHILKDWYDYRSIQF